jgi:hypothetical protein
VVASGASPVDFAVTFYEQISLLSEFDYRFATPVPEPETWALMLAGLVGVARMQRRRRTT